MSNATPVLAPCGKFQSAARNGSITKQERDQPIAESRLISKRVKEALRLRSPGLSWGIARELRKHVAILEQEIAELEQI